MFQKFMVVAVAVAMSSAVALAGPAEVASFDSYVKDVAAKTGKSEKEVRDDAVDALRKEGKYTDDDLERIGHDKSDFDDAKQVEMVDLLKNSDTFKTSTGLEALRNDTISKQAGDAFDAMKNPDDASAKAAADKAAADKAQAKWEKTQPHGLERDVLILGNIAKVISPKAADAIKSVAPQNYEMMKKFGTVLARSVKSGKLDQAKMEKMIINVANSPKALEGQLVIGDGSTAACMGMAKEAIENMGDFIDGGAAEGKDPKSFVTGMGRRASEKFAKDKQDLEDGIARVCALASSGCKLFSGAIVKACADMGGAKAL